MTIKQVWHPYTKWECYLNGMWHKSKNESEDTTIAIEFTGDYVKYGAAMLKAVDNWHYSCENFLSNLSINRKAYIGHAGVCIELGIPEYVTRLAWGKLTPMQQYLANKEADKAIRIWEQKQRLKSTSRTGKDGVTMTEYQMKLSLN